MNSIFNICVVIFIWTCLSVSDASNVHTVKVNGLYRVNIRCDNVHNFNIVDIPSSAGYVLFEVHSQWYNVTLSYNDPIKPGKYENGTNVGLIIQKTALASNPSTYVQCQHHTKKVKHFKVLVKITHHDVRDPVPGGCNMEYPVPQDPNLHGSYNAFYTNRLAFQYANIGHQPLGQSPKCETQKNRDELKYRLYQYHMKSGDFSETVFLDSLELVLNGNQTLDVTVLGEEVTTLQGKMMTEMMFARYRDRGVIYTVVVEQYSYTRLTPTATSPTTAMTPIGPPEVRRALYVPSVIYGCGTDSFYCVYLTAVEIGVVILLAFLGFYALFIAFAGHRYFQTEMFFFGYLTMKVILLLILVSTTDLGLAASGMMVIGIGLIGGVLWWLFWYLRGFVLAAVVLPAFVAGFLIASLIFNYTPLGTVSVFQVHLNYGLAFATVVMLPFVVLVYFTRFLNIFCCALVGTFLPIFAASLLFSGTFKDIVLDTFKNAADGQYLHAMKYSVLDTNDIVFCVIWAVLFLLALFFQLWREAKRPPFPPCPYTVYKNKRAMKVAETFKKPGSENQYIVNGERAPLITSSRQPESVTSATAGSYGTSPGYVPQKNEVIDPL